MIESELLQHSLRHHVYHLSKTIGERHLFGSKNGLLLAAEYIYQMFSSAGCVVERHLYHYKKQIVENVAAVIPGNVENAPILVIGARYDSFRGTPGANDNATGVASLLEMAKFLNNTPLPISLHLVAFANEEPPFIRTTRMGSYQYAKWLNKNHFNVVGMMISIETIGYYSNEKNSQRYFNFLLTKIYPNIGNFVAFIANKQSKKFLVSFADLFSAYCIFPYKTLCAPGWLPGINSSDQWSFWQFSYPALMITDTGPFSYLHYHSATNTFEKINYNALAHLIMGILQAIIHIKLTNN